MDSIKFKSVVGTTSGNGLSPVFDAQHEAKEGTIGPVISSVSWVHVTKGGI